MTAVIYRCWLFFGLGFIVIPNHGQPEKSVHPLYIAVTEINLNSSDKTLEVSCKLFADDLEQVLEKNNHIQLDIASGKDKATLDKCIPAYVKNHLAIAVDNKPVMLSYIGFEKEKESAYCYFQAENVSSVKKIDISNSLLYDYTTRQINIIHVTVNGKRQSTKLDCPDKEAGFNF